MRASTQSRKASQDAEGVKRKGAKDAEGAKGFWIGIILCVLRVLCGKKLDPPPLFLWLLRLFVAIPAAPSAVNRPSPPSPLPLAGEGRCCVSL